MCHIGEVKFSYVRPMILIMAAAWGGGSCGGGGDPGPTCANVGTDTCLSPAPTYAADVVPIIQARCVVCHMPGGQEPGMPFQTYAQLSGSDTTSTIRFELDLCAMPPAGQPQLTDAERATIIDWIVCGAPND
jgi:uncharacterized membrane protein